MIAFDTETHLIQPGLLAPPLVCGSIATEASGGSLLDRDATRDFFLGWLAGTDMIVGANIAYDFLVMAVDLARNRKINVIPQIFAAYEQRRVFDIQIAETLHAIAQGTLGRDPHTMAPLRGRYSLDTCVQIVLNRKNAKENDTWRLRYAELEDVPIDRWPHEARQYPIDDAQNTLEVALVQVKRNRNLHDLPFQLQKAWCLHLAAAWGLRTDPIATEALAGAASMGREKGIELFTDLGYLRPDGSAESVKIATDIALAYGVDPFSQCKANCGTYVGGKFVPGKQLSEKTKKPIICKTCIGTGLDLTSCDALPRTDPSPSWPFGKIKTSRDALSESGDDNLMALAIHKEDDKILNTYVPFLRQGYDVPITLRPNPVLETGRVSYDGVVQLLPRSVSARLSAAIESAGTTVVGVRDCVVPRPGMVYYSVDYLGGELVTFAQSCVYRVGYSKLGDALNAGMDAHSQLGAKLAGVTYEQFKEDPKLKPYRQTAKAANFGLPGGMSTAKLVLQQRQSGPDTPCPHGPAEITPGVKGYKGLRFCVLIGGESTCGKSKVTEWKNRPCPPLCVGCLEVAEGVRAAWFEAWPEAREYLHWHGRNVDEVGEVTQHYSRRIRGGVQFCAAANGDFQGLLADICGRAQVRVSTEQYVDRDSPLYGSRSILFAHDELFGEAPEERAAAAAERIAAIMIEEFRKGCPDHTAACKAEPTLMRRWYKAAETVRNENGELIPWKP